MNVRTYFHNIGYDICAWKAKKKHSVSPFHFEINFHMMLQLVFHLFTRLSFDMCRRYIFLFFLFSLSLSLSLSFTGLTCSLHFYSWAHTPHQIWIFKLTRVPSHSCGMREPITTLNNDVMLSLKLNRCRYVCMCVWYFDSKKHAFNINLIRSCKRGRKFHRIHLNEIRDCNSDKSAAIC